METLTIFTPTYNRAKFLPRAFEALKRQTLKDFLWMIIDDGSTDNSFLICEKYKKFLVNMNKSQNFLSW